MSGDESQQSEAKKKIAELEAEIAALKEKNNIPNDKDKNDPIDSEEKNAGKLSDKKPKHRGGRWVQSRKKWDKIRENREYAREMDQRLKNHLAAGLKPGDFGKNPRYKRNYGGRHQPYKKDEATENKKNKHT